MNHNPIHANIAVLENLGLAHLRNRCTKLTLHMRPDQLPRVIATLHVLDLPQATHTISVFELAAAASEAPPAFDADRVCQEARERLHRDIATHTARERAADKCCFADTREQQKRRWAREDAARIASRFLHGLGNPFEWSIGGDAAAAFAALGKAFGSAA